MKTLQKASKIGLITFLTLPMLLSACLTQYSEDHEAFLRKKECASYQEKVSAHIEALNESGSFVYWGGTVFYSPNLNTCVSMQGSGTLEDIPGVSSTTVDFNDVFTGGGIKSFYMDQFLDENGNEKTEEYWDAVNSFKTEIGYSYAL